MPLVLALSAQAQIVIAPKQMHNPKLVSLYSADVGVMEAMGVQVGDQVSKGQILAKLDDEKHIYAWKVAALKADNRSVTRIALGEVQERQALLAEAKERLRRRIISEQYVTSLEGKYETALGKMEAAEMADQIADLDLEMARNALLRRYIRSTVDGVVVEIAKPERSKVAQGDTVITIADITELTAELPITPELQKAFESGQAVPVTFGPGKTVYNARVINLKSNGDKKKPGQLAQLIFPSLLPQPFADAVTVVVPPENKVIPEPPSGMRKIKSS